MLFQSKAWQERQQGIKQTLEAGKVALLSPCPHPRSPAWAIQQLAKFTYFQVEPEGFHPELWLLELLRMDHRTTEEFVGWEHGSQSWCDGGDARSGSMILSQALEWQQNGLDMSRSPRGPREYPEDEGIRARNPEAIQLIEKSLMPLDGEILRRKFSDDGMYGVGPLRLDVWLAEESSDEDPAGMLFHWGLWGGERPVCCRSSQYTSPVTNSELEGFIIPSLFPRAPIERRIINATGEIV